MKKTACFFAKVTDLATLERVEFYAQDVQILKDLGFDVRIAIAPTQIRRADFYYVWWWTWAFFPICIAKLFRRPIIITGVFDTPSMPGRSSLHRFLIRRALRAADANIFLSDDEYREVPGKYDVTNAAMVPLAVDSTVYKPGPAPRENFVLSVGWLEGGNAVRKCMAEIVQAAPLIRRAHPEIRFVIAGDKGSYYPVLEKLVRDNGASSYVEFMGAIPKQTKIDLMQRCKIYLQPSRLEGFGLAILEAMSCGAPVVTSAVGAVPEVAGDAAIYVSGTEPEVIAERVSKLLASEPERLELSRKGRTRAVNIFPYTRRKSGLQGVIEELL